MQRTDRATMKKNLMTGFYPIQPIIANSSTPPDFNVVNFQTTVETPRLSAIVRPSIPGKIYGNAPDHVKQSVLGTVANIASHAQKQSEQSRNRRFYLQSLSAELLPGERVAKCLRQIIPGQQNVEIAYSPEHKQAHYKGLVVCSRLWTCPVCAARITEQRADELMQAIATWQAQNGFVALITYTLRHHAGDRLKTLTSGLIEAHRQFKSGRAFQQIKIESGWAGSITSLEVTHGDNGWHPHKHELVFFEAMTDRNWQTLKDTFKRRWQAMIEAQGLDASYEYGLDIRTADSDIYDYVAKFGKLPHDAGWTIDREIAKSPTKISKKDGRTPWQLLEDYGDGDTQAGELFKEYASVFKGRNQLVWSRGLRLLLGMTEEQKTDEELAAETPENSITIAVMSRQQWKQIISQPIDLRGILLQLCSGGEREPVTTFLQLFRIYI